MKTKILTTLLILFCVGLFQLNAQDETPKVQKKIVIVKKTVDENGNETIEKIVKEGDDAENVWISDDNEKINLKGKKIEIHADHESLDGKIDKKIKIVTKDENGEEEVIEWNGDGEMPIEIKEKLEKRGVDVQSIEGGQGIFMIKKGDDDGHSIIEFDIDDNEELTPEMKKRVHRIHKKGHHGEGNHFIHKENNVNMNKAFLGVNIENVEEGVKVTSVIEESAAAEAGIQSGDVIKDISGKSTPSIDVLIDVLSPYNPGDEVSINLLREGKDTQVKAVLKERTDVDFEKETEKEMEIIVISDCDTNFSGDEDIDFIFKSLGDEEGLEEITKEIMVIVEDNGNVTKDVEVIVKVVGDDEVVEETKENPLETAPVVNTDRVKTLGRLNLKSFNAYPNPTNGILNLEFQGKKAPLLVQVVNINGREVYKNNVFGFDGYFSDSVSFEGWPKGNYVIYIIQEGKVYTESIVYN